MRKTKEQKAITLIALIITIVVLLILAVVAINAVTGDGIIQHATNAKTEYEKAQDEEQDTLSYYQQYLDTKGDVGPWKQDGNKIYMEDSEGKITELKIGEIVSYDATEGVEASKLSYTVDKEVVGVTDEQKFQVTNDIVWKVLGIKNGKILLMAADDIAPLNNTVIHMDIAKFNLGVVEELNKICSIYGNGTGAQSARSINVDDVNNITGYNPEELGSGYESLNRYGTVVTYTRGENQITYSPTKGADDDGIVRYTEADGGGIITNGLLFYIEDGEWKDAIDIGESKSFKSTVYRYSASLDSACAADRTINMNMSSESEEFKMLFKNSKTSTDASYYLASKALKIRIDDGYDYAIYYGLRYVTQGGVGNVTGGWSSITGSSGIASVCCIRPVITLEANVQFEKEGTSWKIVD